jgi:hypothetical protein
MAQAVIRWPLTAEAQVLSHVTPREICSEKCGVWTHLFQLFRFPLVNLIVLFLLTLLHVHFALTSTNERSLGTFQKSIHTHLTIQGIIAKIIWSRRIVNIIFEISWYECFTLSPIVPPSTSFRWGLLRRLVTFH